MPQTVPERQEGSVGGASRIPPAGVVPPETNGTPHHVMARKAREAQSAFLITLVLLAAVIIGAAITYAGIVRKHTRELEVARAVAKEADQGLQVVQVQLQKTQADLAATDAELEASQARTEDLSGSVDRLREAETILQGQLQEMRDSLQSLQGAFESSRTAFDKYRREAEATMAELREDRTRLQGELSSTLARLSDLRETTQAEQEAAQAREIGLRQELRAMQAQRDEERVSANRREAELRDETDRLRQSLFNSLRRYDRDQRALTSELQSAHEAREELQQRMETTVDELGRALAQKSALVETQQQRADELREALRGLREEAAELTLRIDELLEPQAREAAGGAGEVQASRGG